MATIGEWTRHHPSARDFQRPVPLEGAYNFRDLGGFATRSGKRVRSRLVYRSDGLHSLTAGDLARLRRLGVSTVIDLRSPAEIERFGVCQVESLPAAYCHVPLVLDPWSPPGPAQSAAEWLAGHYSRLLDESADGILSVMQLLADSATWPAVFHCTGGKDRTGVVAAILLSLLGVGEQDIVADYCRSAPGLTWLRIALEADGGLPADVSSAIFEVPAEAMGAMLTHVRTVHGSAEDWALHAGMPPSVIAALRAGLLG